MALVRRGLSPSRLLVLDRARFPRAKPCGGGLTGHAGAAMAELGLALRVPSIPCGEGEVVYGAHRRVVPLGQPVHIVRREEFDADLVAQARALGVAVVEDEGIDALVPPAGADDPITVVTSAGRRLSARVLVGADGVGSVVRKQLQGGDHRPRRQPLRLARLEIPAPRDIGPAHDLRLLGAGLGAARLRVAVPGAGRPAERGHHALPGQRPGRAAARSAAHLGPRPLGGQLARSRRAAGRPGPTTRPPRCPRPGC